MSSAEKEVFKEALSPKVPVLQGELSIKRTLGQARRFFVIENHNLSYYKSQDDYTKKPSVPKGLYKLSSCEFQINDQQRGSYRIKIISTDKRRSGKLLTLCFTDKTTMNTWLSAFNAQRSPMKDKTSSDKTSKKPEESEIVEFARSSEEGFVKMIKEPKKRLSFSDSKVNNSVQSVNRREFFEFEIVRVHPKTVELKEVEPSEPDPVCVPIKKESLKGLSYRNKLSIIVETKYSYDFYVSLTGFSAENTFLSPKAVFKPRVEEKFTMSSEKRMMSPPKELARSPLSLSTYLIDQIEDLIGTKRPRRKIFSPIATTQCDLNYLDTEIEEETRSIQSKNRNLPALRRSILRSYSGKDLETSRLSTFKAEQNNKRKPGTTLFSRRSPSMSSSRLNHPDPIELEALNQSWSTKSSLHAANTGSFNTLPPRSSRKQIFAEKERYSLNPFSFTSSRKPHNVASISRPITFSQFNPSNHSMSIDELISALKEELIYVFNHCHSPQEIERCIAENQTLTPALAYLQEVVDEVYTMKGDLEDLRKIVSFIEEMFDYYQSTLENNTRRLIRESRNINSNSPNFSSFHKECQLYSNEILRIQSMYALYMHKLLISEDIAALFVPQATLTNRFYFFFEPTKYNNTNQNSISLLEDPNQKPFEKRFHKKFLSLRTLSASLGFIRNHGSRRRAAFSAPKESSPCIIKIWW